MNTTNLILFNKPYGVLSQFSPGSGDSLSLADFIHGSHTKKFYPAGRLDRDSEGLMLLTNDGRLQALISQPRHKWTKTYWVQIEGLISDRALNTLHKGVHLKDGLTLPAIAQRIAAPTVWPRVPPIRERKTIPDCWIQLDIQEGKNRQVRRMTAAVGHPTLRLIRYKIGDYSLHDLVPGEFKMTSYQGQHASKRPTYRGK